MVGGVKFYERAKVKDVISYLRLVANENDDFSLKRVINRPKRGLGKVSLAKIEKIAFEHKFSLFEAISNLDKNDKDLSKKIVSSLGEFAANLRELKECDSLYEPCVNPPGHREDDSIARSVRNRWSPACRYRQTASG